MQYDNYAVFFPIWDQCGSGSGKEGEEIWHTHAFTALHTCYTYTALGLNEIERGGEIWHGMKTE